MSTKYSCPHCGQHVVIDSATPGIAVNCPNCGTSFVLSSRPVRKGLLRSPLYWGAVLALAGVIVATISIIDMKKVGEQRVVAVKPVPKVVMSTNSAPLEGRSLSAWVEDVDVDYLDTPEAKHARDVLKQGGPSIIPDIIAILNDPTSKARLRGNAAQALGWAGTKDGPEVEALWNALGDEQRYVRYSASYSLRRLRVDARRLVPKLIEMLDDPDSYVRRGVADNLGVIGKPARMAIPNLQKLLNDDEQKTRDKAAQAIKKLEATSPPTAGTPTTQ